MLSESPDRADEGQQRAMLKALFGALGPWRVKLRVAYEAESSEGSDCPKRDALCQEIIDAGAHVAIRGALAMLPDSSNRAREFEGPNAEFIKELVAAIEGEDPEDGFPADENPWLWCALRVVPVLDSEKGRRIEREVHSPEHSTDFIAVNWFGVKYDFTKTQAACVRMLWIEWERGTNGLSEKTIGDAIDTSGADRFRLDHVFRQKNEMHPAWGKMIVRKAKGIYGLADPESPQNHQ